MQIGTTHVALACWKCSCDYALPMELYKAAKCSPEIGFHCPYGHSARFPAGDTEADKLRRERDRLKQQMARVEQVAADNLKLATSAQRKVKKLEKRASAGTCPCCQRTFSNMASHMKTKHPQFFAENVVQLKTGA